MGKKKKNKEDQQVAAPSPRSITDVILGPELVAGIRQRETAPIGFGPEYVSRTRPAVENRLARLRDYELPALAESLGARGISRSSVGADLERRTRREAEQDIDEIIAQAEREQAGAKFGERSQALSAAQGAVSEEMAGRRAYDALLQQQQAANAELKARAQQRSNPFLQLAAIGLDTASSFAGPMSLARLIGRSGRAAGNYAIPSAPARPRLSYQDVYGGF